MNNNTKDSDIEIMETWIAAIRPEDEEVRKQLDFTYKLERGIRSFCVKSDQIG